MRERSVKDSWVVPLICISSPLSAASISVALQRWSTWTLWSPPSGLDERRDNTSHALSFTLCYHVSARLCNFHWLTADLKHVWWMWRVGVQGDGLQGKSGEWEDALQGKRRQSFSKKSGQCTSASSKEIIVMQGFPNKTNTGQHQHKPLFCSISTCSIKCLILHVLLRLVKVFTFTWWDYNRSEQSMKPLLPQNRIQSLKGVDVCQAGSI